MSAIRAFTLLITHCLAIAVGFAGGIYTLPILLAPTAPSSSALATASANAQFTAQIRRNLEDSDALHWGEGQLYVSSDTIAFEGKMAPGPDYKLYLSPSFVETEAQFEQLKSEMVLVGDIKSFDGFMIPIPNSISPANYTSAIVWCESFGEFITAGQYRSLEQ